MCVRTCVCIRMCVCVCVYVCVLIHTGLLIFVTDIHLLMIVKLYTNSVLLIKKLYIIIVKCFFQLPQSTWSCKVPGLHN